MKNFKKLIPKRLRKTVKNYYNYFIILTDFKKREKVFCISMQRNGTTSVGKFLDDNGYKTQHYGDLSRKWSEYWVNGDYEKIFKSIEFKSFNGYEDNPWWFPDFYRILYNRFPKAKFILFYRDSDKWFESMYSHPEIFKLVNHYIHNKIYNRLEMYYTKIDNDSKFKPNIYDKNNHLPFGEMRENYIKVYELYNREVKEFFEKNVPERLFISRLEDDNKWNRLTTFLDIKLLKNYNVHIKSPKK